MLNGIIYSVADYQEDEDSKLNTPVSSKIVGEKAFKFVMIDRTRPKTCDRVVNLYTLTTKIPEKSDRKSMCDR